MVTISDLKCFVNSSNYIKLLNVIVDSLSLPLRGGDIPIQVFNIYADCVNKANLSLDELNQVINDKDKIANFIKIHLKEITEDNDINENDDEEDTTIEILPFYSNFLISFIVEYYLLKNSPDKLDNYLKVLKIPGYKQHALKLKNIYRQI